MSGGDQKAVEGAEGRPETARPPGGRSGHRRRRAILASIVVLIVIAAMGLSVIALKPAPKTALVGVIVPVDEGIVGHSEEVRDAVQMAMDELNAWGGIGNTRLRMVFEEVPGDSVSVTEAFEDMEAAHHPLFYITISCGFLGTLASLAEEVQAPLIGLSSYPGATEGFQYTYRYNIPPEVEVASAMSVMSDLNVTSVGLLYTQSPHGCTVHEAFSEAFTGIGGTVQDEPCALDETDFSAQIANLTGTEAIFAVSTCTSLAEMFVDIGASDYDGYVVSSSCGSSAFMWNLDAADGVYVSAPLLYKKENILARAFIEDFKQTYGLNVTHHGAVVYDIVHLVHGLLEGNEVTRASLELELSKGFMFTGVMGSLSIAGGEHDFDFSVYPARIVEGELLYL